jgi:hypothetical protein
VASAQGSGTSATASSRIRAAIFIGPTLHPARPR